MLQLTDVTYSWDWLGMFDFLFFCRGIWVAMLVARLLATAALWVRIQTSQKYKIGDIIKGMANTKTYPSVYRLTTLWCSAVCDETAVAMRDLLGSSGSE
jgi:hypothetical protein